jgi:hypothetical protein
VVTALLVSREGLWFWVTPHRIVLRHDRARQKIAVSIALKSLDSSVDLILAVGLRSCVRMSLRYTEYPGMFTV